MPGAVSRIADFIEVDADEERLEIATRQAQIDFMSAHPTLWDDNLLRKARNEACGLPKHVGSTKVRSQSASPRVELTPCIVDAWNRTWAEVVEPATGFASYSQLRERLDTDG